MAPITIQPQACPSSEVQCVLREEPHDVCQLLIGDQIKYYISMSDRSKLAFFCI